MEKKARIYQQDLLARAITVEDVPTFLQQLADVKAIVASGFELSVMPLAQFETFDDERDETGVPAAEVFRLEFHRLDRLRPACEHLFDGIRSGQPRLGDPFPRQSNPQQIVSYPLHSQYRLGRLAFHGMERYECLLAISSMTHPFRIRTNRALDLLQCET